MIKEGSRIIFVNRFAQPDISATAQILKQVSTALTEKGHRVQVITSRSAYADKNAEFPRRENLDDVEINRIWTSKFGRSNLIGRLIDYASFYFSSFFSVLKHAQKGDIVISKTDPPLLGNITGLASAIKGAKKVNWLQDLYPEVAAKLGVTVLDGPFGKILAKFRNFSLTRADMNVAIGNRMAQHLDAQRVPKSKISVLTNFFRDDEVQPLSNNAPELRKRWGFSDNDFIVGYSGNLGRAHDVHTVVEAAKILKDEPIKFLFVGGGFAKQTVLAAANKHNLNNLVFQPYQPMSRLAESLSVPDVHWMSLRPSMEGLIVPSKFYGIAAVGRPVIMVGDKDGEIGNIITQNDCGHVVSPGDCETLAETILEMRNNPTKRECWGQNSRRFIEDRASRQLIFQQWHELLVNLNSQRFN